MSDIATLKQENAELRTQLQQLKTILSQTKEYINDLEWRYKFSNDKIIRMQATISELETLVAEKEAMLAASDKAVLHFGAKLWCYAHQYGELAGYIDAQTAAEAPDVFDVVQRQDFLDIIAEYAINAIEGGPVFEKA